MARKLSVQSIGFFIFKDSPLKSTFKYYWLLLKNLQREIFVRIFKLLDARCRYSQFVGFDRFSFVFCLWCLFFAKKKMETANETVLKKKEGTTCCVPLCKSNSMKNPECHSTNFLGSQAQKKHG